MKLVDRIKSYFFAEGGQDIPVSAGQRYPRWLVQLFGDHSEYASRDFTKHSYGENPEFFMVIDRLASIGAGLPRQLIDSETGQEIETPTNEQLDLLDLLTSPSQFETRYEFYYRCLANLYMGDLFIFKETEENDLPASLKVPTSNTVTINENVVGGVQSYSFSYFDTSVTDATKEQVLHLKRPNILMDTHYGLNTAQPTAAIWATSNKIHKSAYYLHNNKGITGTLYAKGGSVMTPKERDYLQKQYDSESKGSNFGSVRVHTGDLGYLQMGMNMSDLKSVEMNIALLRATCATFNVASQLFGDTAASTYSNMEQAEKAMYRNAIMPVVRRLDKALNYWLIGNKNYAFKVNEKEIAILQEDKSSLIQNVVQMYNAGIITLEEARVQIDADMKEVPAELLSNPNEEFNVTDNNE